MEIITAFRLDSQHLRQRLPPGSLLEAAGTCPLQNAAPDAAALSLHARVQNFSPGEVGLARRDRLLMMTHSLRSAIHLFPAADAHVFTRGLLPADEEETRFFIQGVVPGLERVGMTATEVVDLTTQSADEILAGPVLSRDDLGREIGIRIAQRLSGKQLEAWNSPSPYSPGQFLGESIARFALYITCLQGIVCLIPGPGHSSRFARTDYYSGTHLPQMPVDQSAAELVRRFLHACGPSAPAGLAAWAGIHPKQAARIWQLVAPECVGVEIGGQPAWLLANDLPAFQSAPTPTGARFLPPHDPYLSVPDRATIVADRVWQQGIWRTIGNPGVLLLDGRFAGIWRGEKKGQVYSLTVIQAADLSKADQQTAEDEARSLAPVKRCSSVQIAFLAPGSET